jgi:hypothetical protein
MKSLIENLIANIEVSPSFTTYYELKSFQNLEDDATFPIVYIDPIEWTPKLGGYTIQREYKLSLFFADKSDFDYTYAQHKSIIESLEPSLLEFLLRLRDVNTDNWVVYNITNPSIKEAINVFDLNVTGLLLNCTVVCAKKESICY